jgi:hypothetical protein
VLHRPGPSRARSLRHAQRVQPPHDLGASLAVESAARDLPALPSRHLLRRRQGLLAVVFRVHFSYLTCFQHPSAQNNAAKSRPRIPRRINNLQTVPKQRIGFWVFRRHRARGWATRPALASPSGGAPPGNRTFRPCLGHSWPCLGQRASPGDAGFAFLSFCLGFCPAECPRRALSGAASACLVWYGPERG